MSSLYNCHTREYLEKLDFRMKKNKRALNNMGTLSLYNCLKALGYNVLGDYDTSFQYAQNVLSKSHFIEKYKLTIDYYIEKEEYSLARNDINKLKELIPSVKSADYKKKLERFVLQRELWINIKQGNYKGAEEFYTEEVFDCSKEVMVTKVSYYTSLGEILFLKGKTEEAADYLRFAAENGGDTKYQAISAQLLSKLTS